MKNTKKSIIRLFILLAVLTVAIMPESVQAANSDFVIENGVLTEYKGNGGNVIIPDGVKEIGKWVFYCNDKVTEITVPKSVTKCGACCFAWCPSLKKITFLNKNTKMNYSVYGDEETGASGAWGAFYAGSYWKDELADKKGISPTLTIKGYGGSTAEKTAKELAKHPWGNQQVKFSNLGTGKTTAYGIPTELNLKAGKTSSKVKVSYDETDIGIGITLKITYKSTNTKVATVNSKGTVTAKKKGTAKIQTTVLWENTNFKRTFATKVTVK